MLVCTMRRSPRHGVHRSRHASARTYRRIAAAVAVAVVAAVAVGTFATGDEIVAPRADPLPAPRPQPTRDAHVWVSPAELASLPMRGAAWRAVDDLAQDDWGTPDLDDNDSKHDVRVLAGALVAVRTGDAELHDRVADALADMTGELADDVLPLARNISGYVVAADLVGHRTPSFERWLRGLLDHEADGRAGIRSLRESAMIDPSNHGNHARASAFAIARYLGDGDLERTVSERFHDWLGRSGDGFVWKERDWQADPTDPVGINPPDSEIDGLSVDGVLPEEQRRSGDFTTDPEREGYVWEGLQGATAAAAMMERAGYPAWEWEDRAILRAFQWLHQVNDYPAEGDDIWQVWLVNRAYGTTFPASVPTTPGKNLGFTDWTHGRHRAR